jgi:hypothetical protein
LRDQHGVGVGLYPEVTVSRAIRTFLPLNGDAPAIVARFTTDPSRWLPHARRVGPDRWSVPVAGLGIDRPVELAVGTPWSLGGTWWRTFSWRPLPSPGDPVPVDRLLPVLDAELGLVVQGARHLTLVLDGRYHPPGGAVGAAIDAVALGRVARRTVESVLETIADGLRDTGPGVARAAVTNGQGRAS